jgi:hypothetical protein
MRFKSKTNDRTLSSHEWITICTTPGGLTLGSSLTAACLAPRADRATDRVSRPEPERRRGVSERHHVFILPYNFDPRKSEKREIQYLAYHT